MARQQTSKIKPDAGGAQALSVKPADTTPPEPGNEAIPGQEIARLAYSYWEARGCQGGSAEEDWFRAERELKDRRASAAE
jgi:hypothetical protein